jgi:predicted DNA-binding transcriptional regulator AlpA
MSRRPKPPAASGPTPQPDGVSTLITTAKSADALAPLLSQEDLAHVLNASRRTIERMRAAGKLPQPDVHIGKMPRWRPEMVRAWIERGGQ